MPAAVMGVTWLNRQLLSEKEELASKGFGAEVRRTLAERETFLLEQGFAERRGQRVIFMRDLLATLRACDLEQAARALEVESASCIAPSRTVRRLPVSTLDPSRS